MPLTTAQRMALLAELNARGVNTVSAPQVEVHRDGMTTITGGAVKIN